jgi:peroxiredoxin
LQERWPDFDRQGILVVALERGGVEAVRRWATRLALPFPVAVDGDGSLGRELGQVERTLLGRMPAVLAADGSGVVRLAHYGTGMADHPTPDDLLRALTAGGPTNGAEGG